MATQILDVTTIDLVNEGGVILTNIPKATHKMPPYSGFGAKYITTIVSGLSKPASEMLAVLIQDRDIYTNEAGYAVTGVNAKCKLTRAYGELKKADLVKRVRNKRYMINPAAVLPHRDEYQKILDKWKSI